MNNTQPDHNQLWFVPLGGTGEIGMNLNLYGHADRWLMVDCGATFNVPLDPTLDHRFDIKRQEVVIPDPQFIVERKDDLVAIVITHAHEDHIGALTHIWPKLNCPIYATPFAAEVIRRKFYQASLYYDLPIVEIKSGEQLDLGPFTVRWLNITHSITETQSLLISTPLGSVFHTADWKIDTTPVIGSRFKSGRFKKLSNENILAMVCDSTNATREGYSTSEGECAKGLEKLIKQKKGRVIVTCFASNLARLVTVAKIAQRTKRYVALFGRSLENMVSIARQLDIWPEELSIIPPRHIGYLLPHEVLIIATGSQGEPKAALSKLAHEQHRHCELQKGDSVIFSSIVIPGNEAHVEKLVQILKAKGVDVSTEETTDYHIHASGHPNQNDLIDMYSWVKPKCAVPTHGEQVHMHENAAIANRAGVEHQLVGQNGDIFCLSPNYDILRQRVLTGRISIER